MASSARRRRRREPRSSAGENRLWPALAVVVAALAYAVLPESLLVGPRLAIPAVELVLLGALLVTNPRRLVRQTRWSRGISIALACVVIATNLVALGMLVRSPHLVRAGRDAAAAGRHAGVADQRHRLRPALLGDRPRRTGRAPHGRPRPAPAGRLALLAGREPGHVTEVAATSSERSNWRPEFVDYLYVSLTNSSAFSPTDTMPLSARAKALMGLEATAALLTSLLVVARAVGALGQ